MPSNTPSPYSRPWSNTDTVAESRARNFPSIHTTVPVVSRALGCVSIGQQRRETTVTVVWMDGKFHPHNGHGGLPGAGLCKYRSTTTRADEPAGDRTQDLRIKSPLLYQLSYRLWRRRKVALAAGILKEQQRRYLPSP